jgi:hypothetical protein
MADSQQCLEEEKNSAKSSIEEPKTGWLTFGIIVGIIGAFFTSAISLILSVICLIAIHEKKKSFKTKQTIVEEEFDEKHQAINEKFSHIISNVEVINRNITPLQGRVDEIDHELTKPR